MGKILARNIGRKIHGRKIHGRKIHSQKIHGRKIRQTTDNFRREIKN